MQTIQSKILSFLALILLLSACSSDSKSEVNQINPTLTFNTEQVVRDYLAAYNDHDIEAMLTYLDDDVRWMSISGAELRVETAGKQGLSDILKEYFASLPSTRSEILNVASNGNFLNAFEKASWVDEQGETQSHCASSVYELENGLIKNIWYYSSQAC